MHTKHLKISDDLSLPLETVTQAIGILAKRRAGKSYAARRLAERLFKAGQQIVIVDPKGDWWGIRSSADGKSPGLPIVILGGERGDVPLEVNAGEVVGKLVVEERVSVLLDLSLLRKHEVSTFMGIFLETLYRLKAREQYRTPLMLIVDEADAIAPQKPYKGEERMLGAAEDIVRRGGQRGVGCTLITQRSAVLNKNVLTQIQMLAVLRTISPQDLAAIDAWIDVHGTEEERKILKGSLPSLPTGDAWFWSPGWPTVDGIFKRVHVLPIETFDSGATPKPGEKRVEPKNLADVDLDALTRQMAATIEKAKADNPKELQKKVRELTVELDRERKKKPWETKSVETIKTIEKPILKDAQIKRLEVFSDKLSTVGTQLVEVAREITAELKKFSTNGHNKPPVAQRGSQVPRTLPTRPARQSAPKEAGDFRISTSQQRILNSLGWLETVGLSPVVKKQVALMAGQSPTSGGFFNNLGSLRSAGFIDYPHPGSVALTNAGREATDTTDVPTNAEELQRQVCEMVSGSQATILKELIAAYPDAIAKSDLAERVGQSPTSGGYFNNLGRLRSLGMIDYPQSGYASAASVLFLE
jgi:hypothetical protein